VADAGRVIAGSAKGIRLGAPGPRTRPLADRVKQTLFAIVEPDLAGASVLDLFAGSGAAGIEALSRGAASATFVENDPAAVATIRANVAGAAVADRAEIVRDDVVRWLGRSASRGSFELVIVDPPYAETELLAQTLAALGEPDAPLASTARVVAKHFWRDRPPNRVGMLAAERERRFGETSLTFYRRTEADDDPMPVETSTAEAPR
jgi:16S rRNA (guanine966-N2)-methyltransferase